MPVQSLFVPGGSSGVAVAVVSAAIVGTGVVGVALMLSVTVNTLKLPIMDADTESETVVDELVELDFDKLEEKVDVDAVVVKEVAIPLVKAIDAEATKFQSLATNSRVWLLQQLGPVSTQQNASSFVLPTSQQCTSVQVNWRLERYMGSRSALSLHWERSKFAVRMIVSKSTRGEDMVWRGRVASPPKGLGPRLSRKS
jgi:hypothetical protein